MEYIVVATELAGAVVQRIGTGEWREVKVTTGAALEGLKLNHPFYERVVPVVLAAHVMLDAGTGAVHTAPGHGHEDFALGVEYRLPLDNPVGADGRFLPGTELFVGEKVWEANEHIIRVLTERGMLLKHEPFRHSYPHCWRHRTPVIFRATPQWFISMEQARLRADALDAISAVKWTPGWGEQRLGGMIANRPDWCISRQRTWGVPLALFIERESGTLHPRSEELLERVAKLVEQHGIDAWFDLDARELLGEEAERYEKVPDVMDVWADSGCAHYCVPRMHPEITIPADLYLEGSDQHRGWFHSSLLISVAQTRHAPYKGVLTHGFTVDEKGRKQSKSLGNVVAPQKVVGSLGADVLRLWVAATDYSNEMSVSDEILKRMADSYRRLRNTARFLLGNLHGFDPAKHAIAPPEMVALDRWALERTASLQREVIAAYRDFQYHLIYQKVHNFCVVDMGGFYLDVLKDRLYTLPIDNPSRRSAQTALMWIAEAMVRWLAPILSFTAEEIWRFLPGAREQSVLHSIWAKVPEVAQSDIDWPALISLRADVTRQLEGLREQGVIGAPLDAEVDIYCDAALSPSFAALGEELRFLFITSAARVHTASSPPPGAVAADTAPDGIWMIVQPSKVTKCVRCWHHRPDVGSNARHPELCSRCATNIEGTGETRRFA